MAQYLLFESDKVFGWTLHIQPSVNQRSQLVEVKILQKQQQQQQQNTDYFESMDNKCN